MRENDVLVWLLTDQINSTTVTANSDGSLNSEARYSAFGETRYTSATETPTDYLYTGQRIEEEAGLYYYHARFYDPVLSHFVQADTVVPEPGNFISYDRHANANQNPLIYTDPTGHFALLVTAAVGAIVGATVDILVQTIPQYINGTSPLEVKINWAEVAGATVAEAIYGLTLGAGTAIIAGSSATTSIAVMVLSGGLGNVAGNQAGAIVQSSIEMETPLLSGITLDNAASMYGYGDPVEMTMDFAWGAVAGGLSQRINVGSIYSNTPKIIQNEWRLTNNGSINRFTSQTLDNRLGNSVIKPNFNKQIPRITFYTGITTFSNYAESIFTTMMDKKLGKGNNDC